MVKDRSCNASYVIRIPANIYLFKATIGTLDKGVKYLQS